MTMTDLVGELTTLLRAGTASAVEQYERSDLVTAVCAYVQPNRTAGETAKDLDSGVSGGTFFERHYVDIVCRGPWGADATTHEAVDTLVEELKAVIRAHRDITHSGAANCTVGRIEDTRWCYFQRPGTTEATTWGAALSASWRTGSA